MEVGCRVWVLEEEKFILKHEIPFSSYCHLSPVTCHLSPFFLTPDSSIFTYYRSNL
ncbi:hypothetical protein H5968_09950 [Sphaerospermopsis sp. LEGE 00249]|nr:hypothetical protein [Sphaerospermopsis sp. LEGE 00249]